MIRLVFPELTEERRKELAKDIKKKGEGAKVAVRNIRRDAMDHFKKVGKAEDISEDEIKDLEDKIQKLTDSYVAKIDKAVEAKSTGDSYCIMIVRDIATGRCPFYCHRKFGYNRMIS